MSYKIVSWSILQQPVTNPREKKGKVLSHEHSIPRWSLSSLGFMAQHIPGAFYPLDLSFYFPFLLSSSCYFNGAGRGKGKGEGEGIESTGNIWFVEEDFHIPQLPIPFLYLTGNWGTKRKSSIVKPYIPGPLPSFLSLTPLLPFIGFRWRGRRKKAEANKKEVWR